LYTIFVKLQRLPDQTRPDTTANAHCYVPTLSDKVLFFPFKSLTQLLIKVSENEPILVWPSSLPSRAFAIRKNEISKRKPVKSDVFANKLMPVAVLVTTSACHSLNARSWGIALKSGDFSVCFQFENACTCVHSCRLQKPVVQMFFRYRHAVSNLTQIKHLFICTIISGQQQCSSKKY
jgi:hypothetical protein